MVRLSEAVYIWNFLYYEILNEEELVYWVLFGQIAMVFIYYQKYTGRYILWLLIAIGVSDRYIHLETVVNCFRLVFFLFVIYTIPFYRTEAFTLEICIYLTSFIEYSEVQPWPTSLLFLFRI